MTINGHDHDPPTPKPIPPGHDAQAIYQALRPIMEGKPIDQVSMALIAHLAAMIDMGAPGMGTARKSCVDLGDQCWQTIINIRNERMENDRRAREAAKASPL